MTARRENGRTRLDDTAAVDVLRGMLEIPSPSYAEHRLAEHLHGVLTELGFAARIDPAGNVIGEVGSGSGPVVMLLGHLDTIPGEVPVHTENGRIYGRGSVDAKGPLAAMICAAAGARLAAGRVVVVGVVEEETPRSRGAMQIRRDHPQPDAVVIGEPSGWSTVVLGYKGKLDLRYRVERPATHPSNPDPKASELAAHVWTVLTEELGPAAGHGSFDQPGATLCSMTADLVSAEAEFSVRTPMGFDSGALVTAVRSRAPAGELTVLNSVAACRTGRTDPVVRALSAGIRGQSRTPTMKVKTATSDMNTLAEVWSMPMATYGPGDSRLDHSNDEHIVVTDYLAGVAVLTHALEALTSA